MGTEGIASAIDHGCALAELVEKTVSRNPQWEIVSHAQLGIINFRYIGDGSFSQKELDGINQNISKEITDSGFAQIFTTELLGRKVLRMCTIHPETTEKDICDTLERVMNAKAISGLSRH